MHHAGRGALAGKGQAFPGRTPWVMGEAHRGGAVAGGHVVHDAGLHGARGSAWGTVGLREDGGISGVSSSCGARGGFLPRHNYMAAVTICTDFGAQKIKSDTVSTVFPSI